MEVDNKNQPDNRTLLLGCGLLGLAALIGSVVISILMINHERRANHYPGAILVSSHNIYSPASKTVLWDDIYRTSDSLWDIQQWYQTHFKINLDLASHTLKDGCLFLHGSRKHFILERRTSVALCETPAGQTIAVTRSTSIH